MVETTDKDLNSFFKLDFEKGIIKDISTDARVFMLALVPNSVSLLNMFRIFGTGGAVILQILEKGYGRGIYLNLRRAGSSPEAILNFLEKACRMSGWGNAEVSGNIFSGTGLRVEVRDCVSCEGWKMTGHLAISWAVL